MPFFLCKEIKIRINLCTKNLIARFFVLWLPVSYASTQRRGIHLGCARAFRHQSKFFSSISTSDERIYCFSCGPPYHQQLQVPIRIGCQVHANIRSLSANVTEHVTPSNRHSGLCLEIRASWTLLVKRWNTLETCRNFWPGLTTGESILGPRLWYSASMKEPPLLTSFTLTISMKTQKNGQHDVSYFLVTAGNGFFVCLGVLLVSSTTKISTRYTSSSPMGQSDPLFQRCWSVRDIRQVYQRTKSHSWRCKTVLCRAMERRGSSVALSIRDIQTWGDLREKWQSEKDPA